MRKPLPRRPCSEHSKVTLGERGEGDGSKAIRGWLCQSRPSLRRSSWQRRARPTHPPGTGSARASIIRIANAPKRGIERHPGGYSAVRATRLGIAGRAAKLLGSSYSATRTTRSGSVVVQFAKRAEFDPRVLDELPDRVDVCRVPLSQRTLDAAQDSAVAELERLDFESGVRVSSREGKGSIIVAAEHIGANVRAALPAASKPANLILRWSSPIHLRQYPPHQGGLRLNIGGFSCMSGFDVVDRSEISLVLTAGHCVLFGDPVSIAGVPVGTIEESVFDGGRRRTPSDSALYSVPAENQTARVFTGAALQPVRNVVQQQRVHVGMRVCFFGYRSARQRCGRIYARKVTTVDGMLVIGTSSSWSSRAPVLERGRPIVATDQRRTQSAVVQDS